MESAILLNDYRHAVVHVACFLHDHKMHLIFAAAELLPAEIPKPPKEPVYSIQVNQHGEKVRVFFRRYLVSAEQALGWYEQCRNGKVALFEEDTQFEIKNDPLFPEPKWPALILGAAFRFTGDVASTSRSHHLYPGAVPGAIAKLFQIRPDAEKWVSDRIFVSLTRYPELAGSVHLVVPNPVLRSAHMRLHVENDGSEASQIDLIARNGMSAKGLEVTLTEHRPTGICAMHRVVVSDTHVLIPHLTKTDQVEMVITCPRRGLLEWQGPHGFLRRMNIEGHLFGTRKRISVPGKDGEPPTSYDISLGSKAWSSALGEPESLTEIPLRLRRSERDRQRSDEAERLGQKWFHGNREEATQFIRSLIGAARQRVWIVDPYFATIELFSFALSTAYKDVEVVVLTSSWILKRPDSVDPSIEAGEALCRQIDGLPELKHVSIRVMTGDSPAVHDRFLVLDENVWFTGNSLNSIGERAGMMICLPEPTSITEKLDSIIKDSVRSKELSTWVSERKAATEP